MSDYSLDNCHDCGAQPGQQHMSGCDTERCSVCGGQWISCGCDGHDKDYAKWSGIWPGFAEATLLGMDLNQFERSGYAQRLFVKKGLPAPQGSQESGEQSGPMGGEGTGNSASAEMPSYEECNDGIENNMPPQAVISQDFYSGMHEMYIYIARHFAR